MTFDVQCWSTWDEKTTLLLVVENQVLTYYEISTWWNFYAIQNDEEFEQENQGLYEKISPKTNILYSPSKMVLGRRSFPLQKCFLFQGLVFVFRGVTSMPCSSFTGFFLLEGHCYRRGLLANCQWASGRDEVVVALRGRNAWADGGVRYG